ncbi:thioredoxin domain-containing protein, partial [Candidatus Sumerlaeota bacterium]|nr:thioredoxin domain-containing protein [Candidatus Sumerlaeota bacterium]
MPSPAKHTNRLAGETSPYLLQHAHNPVDWYPWGEEAISKSRAENKPIFLSIGYSACHWCHVMEHESFENESIASVLNEHFVSIKVDREERPDLDDLYMQAVQMMTRRGGWPMSVFLTPELQPFFGGTYFPPEDGPRGTGFRTLLLRLADLYASDSGRVAETAQQIVDGLKQAAAPPRSAEQGDIHPGLLSGATDDLRRNFDSVYGGFGHPPKFPPSMSLGLLLTVSDSTGDLQLRQMVEKTLTHMANGGIYDQLLGGFHRYSTDHLWLVPHFEKMLYDNALLAPIYFDASILTGNRFYADIGRGVLDYVLGSMTSPEGGYYSTEDADSEGVEGKFYVWSREEVISVLGEDEGQLFCDFYDVTDNGNFEGSNILHVITPLEEFAKRHDQNAEETARRIGSSREKLETVRRGRIHPGKDDKILTAWNGMMISAMARGAQATGEERYADSAERAARFLLDQLRDGQGGLLRTWRNGKAKINAFAEDYALLATAMVDLYETTFDPDWLKTAAELADMLIEKFHDDREGGFFTNDGTDATVLVRRKETYDGATPSGNSVAAFLLLRLALLLDRPRYHEIALQTIQASHSYLSRSPGAVHHLLRAVAFELASPKEIALVGDPSSPRTAAL